MDLGSVPPGVYLSAAIILGVLLVTEWMKRRSQQHFDRQRRRLDAMGQMTDGDKSGLVTVDGSLHAVDETEVHTIHCDMGITIHITEATETTDLTEPETMQL